MCTYLLYAELGRCYALLGERDPEIHLHVRCRQNTVGDSLFCRHFHSGDRDRVYGTVWQHRTSCTVCAAAKRRGTPYHPTDAYTDPVYAPDPEPKAPKPARPSANSVLSVAAGRGDAGTIVAATSTSGSGAPAPSGKGTSPSSAASSSSSSSAAPVAARTRPAAAEEVLHEHSDPRHRALLARFVGPTGIKLRVRLARCLQVRHKDSSDGRSIRCAP